jgi:hypothetical protein
MRPAAFVCLALVVLPACSSEPDSEVLPAEVTWMEWPAEVLAAEPFTVRLVGYGASCREVLKFDPGATADNSAVTFEPFFLVSRHIAPCPIDRRVPFSATLAPPIIAPYFDTRAGVAGLTPQTPRSYEIRGAADVSLRGTAVPALPVRMFGEIVVRSDSVDRSRTNAGGIVYAYRDSTGCVSLYTPVAVDQLILENPPADTATYWTAFVRGYVHKVAAPKCGATVVFHLDSRN